jgi:hypothetical protein
VNREFRVGEWLVRPDLNSIEREGEEHSIEPKVIDVLVLFAEQGAVSGRVCLHSLRGSGCFPPGRDRAGPNSTPRNLSKKLQHKQLEASSEKSAKTLQAPVAAQDFCHFPLSGTG